MLFAENDLAVLVGCAIIGGFIAVNFGMFAKDDGRKVIYWICLIALHAQSLLFVFQFTKVVELSKRINPAKVQQADKQAGTDNRVRRGEPEKEKPPPLDGWTEGQALGLVVALFPFLFPMIAAYITGEIVGNHFATIGAFTFWSLVQTLILGKVSGQDKVFEGFRPLIRSAIPVISTIISLVRAYNQ
jgi:hypothetical protein